MDEFYKTFSLPKPTLRLHVTVDDCMHRLSFGQTHIVQVLEVPASFTVCIPRSGDRLIPGQF